MSETNNDEAIPGKPLPEITKDGAKVQYWRFKDNREYETLTDLVGLIRVYYNLSEREGDGFEFCAIRVETFFGTGDATVEDAFSDGRTRVKVLATGRAAFDGVRHTYFGDDSGYFHCPSFDRLHDLLDILEQLEERFCRDPPER